MRSSLRCKIRERTRYRNVLEGPNPDLGGNLVANGTYIPTSMRLASPRGV